MKMPFEKNSHVRIIKEIAYGLHKAGVLNRYLELGIRKGPCFNVVAPLSKEAYGVDINNCYKFIKVNKNLVWYHGATTDFLKSHDKNKKFDLVFIDADHRHESSLNDFKLVLPLVNDNGLILLHDTYPTRKELTTTSYCGDSYKTADYIRKNYSDVCEICTLPFYYGVSVVRKLDRQLMWKQK
jgi:hypothetical protein